MHHKNKHKNGYDFTELVNAEPSLSKYIIKNTYNNQDTIDFSAPGAVKALNTALLKSKYNINYWDIPDNYLCPGVPGRADYIHHLNDLLTSTSDKTVKAKRPINVLDIGTGASCIYPILGQSEYNWHFVATDIDPVSVKIAQKLVEANGAITNKIEVRLQKKPDHIFKNIIHTDEFYHLTLCNPPFHRSLADADKGSTRKRTNLTKQNAVISHKQKTLNFGGQKAELWCPGGELVFIHSMIKESQSYQKQVLWFTCLVSKKDHLSKIQRYLKKFKVAQSKVINMTQGQKISRFIAWSFIESD